MVPHPLEEHQQMGSQRVTCLVGTIKRVAKTLAVAQNGIRVRTTLLDKQITDDTNDEVFSLFKPSSIDDLIPLHFSFIVVITLASVVAEDFRGVFDLMYW